MRKLFFLFLIFLVGCSSGPGKYDAFAQCLSENDAVMYGTEWCPHCQDQKKMFGKSFQFVEYVDCDLYRDQCTAAGIRGYPTWVVQGESYSGTQQLFRLASLTKCRLEPA